MTEEIKYRKLSPDDMPALVSLNDAVLGTGNQDWYSKIPDDFLDEHIEKDDFFGAFDGDKLVGFILLKDRTRCSTVAVLPEYRGRGIMIELVRCTINRALEYGATGMTASVHPDNIASIRAIEGFGFKRNGQYFNMSHNGAPRIVFQGYFARKG